MSAQCTVGRWLTYWLSIVEQWLRPPTVKAYQDHVRLFLAPYLGPIPLNRLTRRHLVRMFAMISRRQTRYGTPIAAATLERIRATLRAALNEAVREDLIADNPARGLHLPTPRHVHPVVWTARQVALWKCTGERPPVAVWTPEQLAQFLAFVRNDSLFALWWLIALRGLRRGEAAGLRWVDLDIERRVLAITRQVVRTPAGLKACQPKSEASVRNIALDPETLRILRRHERVQKRELGPSWSPVSPMFTGRGGRGVDPNFLTHRFHTLVIASGLPPIRLHDLRHGAATLALAAGDDLKVVQGLLGHASIVVTADIYTSVLPQLYHDSARKTAHLVMSAARKTARNTKHPAEA